MYRVDLIEGRWVEIDSIEGTFWIPQYLIGNTANPTIDDIGDYCPCLHSSVLNIRIVDGYGVRWSMPGYLDCGEWTVYQDEDEARMRANELRLEVMGDE